MKKQFLKNVFTAALTAAFGTALSVSESPTKAALKPNFARQPHASMATSTSTVLAQGQIQKGTKPGSAGANLKPQLLQMVKGGGGMASWYGPGFHGRRTANGEVFNQNALTAAHRSLPFGTKVRVTNSHTGRSIIVRINDRGPFVGGRVIDLSAAAARAIGLVRSGVAPVQIEVLGR